MKERAGKRNSTFKDRVLKVVARIPRGRVLTYREVAKRASSPRAWRAVGSILNKNYDPKIVCHRVIRSDGKIGGYNRGTKNKISLLQKEGVKI
ncbi:MAG: MGMT family protein [Candidatus Moranbacteria bacterium]|nr:MGMT family protein [Candidatus Moranbacteria bacterium]